jgi:hypothetical protein
MIYTPELVIQAPFADFTIFCSTSIQVYPVKEGKDMLSKRGIDQVITACPKLDHTSVNI